ncbi:tetratricopeptide repeat protein [Pelagibius sp.]|uniref:tetratricopeptide repeat protein n=1 Tax=Pelagibius sp. TaxID=1931238 RepID=UPI0026166872|nr:tetratricopeptide repeat protein [Pelagibius sp.]
MAALAACQTASPNPDQSNTHLDELSRLLADARLCKPVGDPSSWQARIEACTRLLGSEVFADQRLAGYTNRGILFKKVGKEAEALADFNAAIEAFPDSAIGYANRGDLFSTQGKHELAALDFRKAYDLDPENAIVLNNYAWSLVVQDDYAAALSVLDQAMARSGEPGAVGTAPLSDALGAIHDTRAHALMGLGRLGEARTAFSRAIEFGGSERVVRYQSALVAKGYAPGRTDGVMDAQTDAALSACIRDNCRLLLE